MSGVPGWLWKRGTSFCIPVDSTGLSEIIRDDAGNLGSGTGELDKMTECQVVPVIPVETAVRALAPGLPQRKRLFEFPPLNQISAGKAACPARDFPGVCPDFDAVGVGWKLDMAQY
jgi:hypothetical protein